MKTTLSFSAALLCSFSANLWAQNPQPAILGAAGTSNKAIVWMDPSAAPSTQNVVSGLPTDAQPHGVSYFGSDSALISDFSRSRVHVVQVSTAALVSTLNTATAGYDGTGTIAVAPSLSAALAMGSNGGTSTNLYVIRSPFNASSTVNTVTLPSGIASYQTQAIVFNNSGRAFVYQRNGISVLDPPYSSVAFSIPVTNSVSGALAISPDGNTLLATDLSGTAVKIFQGPFSAASTSTSLSITGGGALDGIVVTPDGTKAIVVSSSSGVATRAAAISAPFSSSSTVEVLPMPSGNSSAGFEDIGISADSQLAILTGNGLASGDLAVFVKAPFTAAGAQSSAVALQTGGSAARGAGAVRFLPPGLAPGLTISKSAPAFVNSGSDITYTISYSNTGTMNASNVVIRDPVPDGTVFVSAANGGMLVGDTVVFNIGTVNANSGTQTVSFTVNVPAASRTTITNSGYTIEATGVSPIAGPPVSTMVTGAQLLNISTRGPVMDGDKVLIGGFMITGDDPKMVIIRGMGPSLALNHVPLQGRLADPTITLMQGDTDLETNDSWREHEQEVLDTGLAPNDDHEAVIVRTLNPGAYTVLLSGEDNTTGLGLVEVFDGDSSTMSRLANISTRGMVETNDSVLIGGFIVGTESVVRNRASQPLPNGGAIIETARVIVRAIGPSLQSGGMPLNGRLADPTIQLVNANGVTIGSNDDWKSTQQSDIEDTHLAPMSDKESAIVATLVSGSYTAIMRGAGGTTGIGLVEIYQLPFETESERPAE